MDKSKINYSEHTCTYSEESDDKFKSIVVIDLTDIYELYYKCINNERLGWLDRDLFFRDLVEFTITTDGYLLHNDNDDLITIFSTAYNIDYEEVVIFFQNNNYIINDIVIAIIETLNLKVEGEDHDLVSEYYPPSEYLPDRWVNNVLYLKKMI